MKTAKLVLVMLTIATVTGYNVGLCSDLHAGAQKSPSTASEIGYIATLAPAGVGIALMANEEDNTPGLLVAGVGLAIGPGLGHAYAGNTSQFVAGTVVRLAAGCAAITAFREVSLFGDEDGSVPMALGTACSLVCFFSLAHDLTTADDSAVKYNHRGSSTGLTITPTYFAEYKAYGLSIQVHF